MGSLETSVETIWKLVEQRTDDARPQTLVLAARTLTIGRTNQATFVLQSAVVSKLHASITVSNGKPKLQDLSSTNGTFVNGKRIESIDLREGDMVRFANLVFLVECETLQVDAKPVRTSTGETTVPWTAALLQFEELMDPGGVVPHFQPIVRMSDRQRIGFECLARSDLEQLSSPQAMFDAASELGQEQELSELMRRTSIRGASGLGGNPGIIFLNAHPTEQVNHRLEESLRELRRSAPQLNIAIEIQEDVVGDKTNMLKFRSLLRELDMQLVYDDFGADQARLVQLVETPPDFLKFDNDLIRGIDFASDRHRELVRSLVEAVHRLGIASVAEGVETEAEANTCSELGFQLGQGFLFGRPDSIAALVEAAAETVGA